MNTGLSALVASDGLKSSFEEYFAGTGTPGEAIVAPDARSLARGAAAARFETIAIVSPKGFIPPKEIELLVPWLDRGFRIVVGSRFFPGSRFSQRRANAPWIWAERVRAQATGWWTGLSDGCSGFAVIRKVALIELLGSDGRFDLARAAERGWAVKEVGVMWIAEITR